MGDTVKERVIDSMFDRWCDRTEFPMEVQAAMKQAVKKSGEDTILQVVTTAEENAYKSGFRDCLELIKELWH